MTSKQSNSDLKHVYLKLGNGEDIVGELSDGIGQSKNHYHIKNPYRVHYMVGQDGLVAFTLLKWIPYPLNDMIPISKDKVIVCVEVGKVMIDHYKKVTERNKDDVSDPLDFLNKLRKDRKQEAVAELFELLEPASNTYFN